MTLREEREVLEQTMLSDRAAHSAASKGRQRQETLPPSEQDLRTAFQRDRDRIIHCKSFRRLKHKTQVFLSPEGDHYRTRLTHTLEVSQIARTIARALRLNEDLTEAIALGHDLGHTPFGHAGERALNDLLPKGFRHYEQSVRVVDHIEKEGEGLNLTYEVRDGILCHTKGQEAQTLEGRILRFADRIAYMNHDIDDAIRAGMMQEDALPELVVEVLGRTKAQRITTMICSLIAHSREGEISLGPEIVEAYEALHDYLFEHVYLNEYAKSEERKVPLIMERLLAHFQEDTSRLPGYMQEIARREGAEIAAADYVSGMTDQYAVACFRDIYIPRAWNK